MDQLQIPFIVNESGRKSGRAFIPEERPRRRISEARRAYLRRYYEANKEKAREYQRRYNLLHKKKARLALGASGVSTEREAVRETFHASDIMQAPTEKSARIIQLILRGERYFTM